MPDRLSLLDCARRYVEAHIAPEFHEKRLAKLAELDIVAVLKRKNPYLFLAKAITSEPDRGKQLLLAWLSSQEETLFGNFLEGLAIHICQQAYGGKKSSAEGIDLDFVRAGKRYLVSIKSEPNWANSSQIARMIQNFDRARRIVGSREHVIAVNGCCYGKDARVEKTGNYLKLCGQDFWHLISGEAQLYQEMIEPLGVQARQRNDAFEEAFGRLHTRLSVQFSQDFCDADGSIDWHKILTLNSAAAQLWQP